MGELILVVDKNKDQRVTLERIFIETGFQALGVSYIPEALKLVQTLSPKAIILELDLPDRSGLDFCRIVRNEYNNWTPIILTSSKDDELDTVLGLEMGADDYLIKPLRSKEVVARVKAIIRRGSLCCSENTPQMDQGMGESKLINGELQLDPDHFLFYIKGEAVDLTRKEYELLYYLFKHKGKVLTRNDLIQELAGDGVQMDERIIDVFISRIRNKIEPSRRNPLYIKTVRNLGYMMMDISPIKSNQSFQAGVLK